MLFCWLRKMWYYKKNDFLNGLFHILALTCVQPRKFWAKMTVTARLNQWYPEMWLPTLNPRPAPLRYHGS